MRILGVLALATVVSACGPGGAGMGGGVLCTEIGSPTGIGVKIAPPLASDVSAADLRACWGDQCRTRELTLTHSTEVVATECAGDQPDDSCSARLGRTGGKNAFAGVRDLPTEPVRVTLTLTDSGGDSLVEQTLDVTPRLTYPNGPDCPSGGPQANLAVDADGGVTAD
jgi:hypothetical protein